MRKTYEQLTPEEQDYYNWIIKDEAVQAAAAPDQEKARKYYESKQSPDFVPKGITYVERNLVTDLVNGLVGQLIGSDIDIELYGAGDQAKGLIELVYDMFERNRFNQRVKEPWANYFYVEGKSGIQFYFNPRKKSMYGMGFPELIVKRPNQTWLDSNSKGMMHEDDRRRINPVRILVSYAQQKWPEFAEEIYETSDTTSGRGTHAFCDLYEIEFYKTEFKTDEDGLETEEDVYYKTKVINKLINVEKAKPTGFRRFTNTVGIHTPREVSSTEPIGAVFPILQAQDLINSIGSAAFEALKHDIKNALLVLGGATPIELATAKKDIAKPNAVISFKNATKVDFLQKQSLSVPMLQMLQSELDAFDQTSGRYAPERGVAEQNLSGKAIGLLHQRGRIPEQTKKLHLEFQLTEIVMLMLECAQSKLSAQPFAIEREINGKSKKIYYNTPRNEIEGFKPDEYNYADEDGIVNNLMKIDIDNIDLSINLKMNALEEEAYEAEKAMVAYDRQLLPPKITLNKLYPHRGDEYYNEFLKYSEAMRTMEALQENPEMNQMVVQMIGEIDKLKQMEEMAASGKGIKPQTNAGQPSRMGSPVPEGVPEQ